MSGHAHAADAHDSHAADSSQIEDPQALMDEDSEAWHGVTGLLIAIASVGLVMGIITAFIAL